MRAVVVGAGVAGLAAGLALRRASWDVVVLERRPALDDSERGELIWANGVDALADLGLDDAVRAAGKGLEDEDFRSWRGGALYRVPVRELAEAAGRSQPTVVRRRDLLRVLFDALPDRTVRFGAEATGVEQEHGAVTVTSADGAIERGDVLLAADGARSRMRTTALDGPYAHIAPGTWAYGVCAFPDRGLTSGRTLLALGRGDRFLVRDLGNGSASWLAVVADGHPVSRERLLERFRAFSSPVPALIASTPPEAIRTEDVRWVDALDTWHDGAVVLLGDAAHAASPTLARGAGEALIDASLLGALLTERGVDGGIAAYVDERKGKTASVQAEAQRIERIFNLRSPLAVPLREQVMRRVLSRGVAKRIGAELRS